MQVYGRESPSENNLFMNVYLNDQLASTKITAVAVVE
jgi:hypothetical protein